MNTILQPHLQTLSATFAKKLDKKLRKVPFEDYAKTIIELANSCEVSEHIVYNWRTGRTFLKKSDRVMIESFFNEKIF